MSGLRIRGWLSTFETRVDERRPKRALPWTSTPADLSSAGQARLLAQWENGGREALAVWPLLVQIVAELPADRRDGTLRRTSGKLHTPETIADRLRIPLKQIQKAIEALSDEAVDWLEMVDQDGTSISPGGSPGTPGDRPVVPRETAGGSQADVDVDVDDNDKSKRSTSKQVSRAPYSKPFETLWKNYPKKVGKKEAYKAWKAASKAAGGEEALLSLCRDSLPAWRNSERWTQEDGRFILDPVRWIKRGHYADNPEDLADV